VTFSGLRLRVRRHDNENGNEEEGGRGSIRIEYLSTAGDFGSIRIRKGNGWWFDKLTTSVGGVVEEKNVTAIVDHGLEINRGQRPRLQEYL
jgi:hypothetical protein